MFNINLWVYLLLPLPVLIWFLVPKIKNLSASCSLKIPFFHAALNWSSYKLGSKKFNLVYFSIIWLLLVIALSGPKWIGPPQIIHNKGYDIVLALDLSESMSLADMQINGNSYTRLSVVKYAAKNFVKNRPQDKIGLVLFGSKAYLQTPLTYDHKTVLLRLKDAAIGLAGKMTALGDAIGLSTKILKRVKGKTKIIILLTDGVNNAGVLPPMDAAALAKDNNIKIYTIGLGTYQNTQNIGNLLLSFSGLADLDEDTLKNIAKETGGKYFRAYDVSSLLRIYSTIDKLERTKHKGPTFHQVTDYYKIPLVVALVMLLLFLILKKSSNNPWLKVCDLHLLQAMMPQLKSKNYSFIPIFLSVGFIIMALVAPALHKANTIVYKTIVPRVILLDLSQDMLNDDIAPNRLVRAKFKILDLLKKQGQYGLMVYTSEPFVVSPITDDAKTITTFMPDLEPDLVPVSGSNLSLALEESTKLFERAGVKFGQILVLTGTAPNSQDISLAKKLHAKGLQISILPVLDKANFDKLFKIFAKSGGGKSLDFSNDDSDLNDFIAWSKKEYTLMQNIELKVPQDDGKWFIIPALICLLPLFRRGFLQRFDL